MSRHQKKKKKKKKKEKGKKIKPFENKIIKINRFTCDVPHSMRCSTECFTEIIEFSVERQCRETVFKITSSMH